MERADGDGGMEVRVSPEKKAGNMRSILDAEI